MGLVVELGASGKEYPVMNTSFTAIDWNELTKFKDGSSFTDWRLELEEDPEWLIELGLYSDSLGDYWALASILKQIVEPSMQEPQKTHLRESLMKVVCSDVNEIVRDFPFEDEDCYYIALSPGSVAKIVESLDNLDMDAVLAAAAEPFSAENDSYTIEEAREYIQAFSDTAREASRREFGLLQYAG